MISATVNAKCVNSYYLKKQKITNLNGANSIFAEATIHLDLF